MLRLVVLLLLLANAGYFAWSQGLLAAWGYAPHDGREPQRLAQQIHPEAIRVVKPADAARAEAQAAAQAAASTQCLQAEGFDEAQTAVLRRALEDLLPQGSWMLDETAEPARWIVYMGKYASAQALAAKRAELAGLKVKSEPLQSADLGPGLSLGGFGTQREADAALADFGKRGVRTARVVQEKVAAKRSALRLPQVDEALRARLDALGPALGGRSLGACR